MVEHLGVGAAMAGWSQEHAVALDAFAAPVRAINIGLETFHSSLADQGATSVHVEWRPPAGGNERLVALLDRMKGRIEG